MQKKQQTRRDGKIMFIATLFGTVLMTFSKAAVTTSMFFSGTEMSLTLLANQSVLWSIFTYSIFLLIFFLSVGLPLMLVGSTILNWRRNKRLRLYGTAAQAKILKIWDTGVSVNDNPQVGMQMIIYAADRPPFQAETKSIVSRLQIPLIQVGSLVDVKYDRQDPSKVALVI